MRIEESEQHHLTARAVPNEPLDVIDNLPPPPVGGKRGLYAAENLAGSLLSRCPGIRHYGGRIGI